MKWTRLLQALGALGIVGGGVAIWVAFQRQMCAGSCAPNVVYLVPGVLALLFGIGLVRLGVLSVVSVFLAAGTLLYDLFVLLVRGESLTVGLLVLVLALLFAGLAIASEALRTRYGHRQDLPFGTGVLRSR